MNGSQPFPGLWLYRALAGFRFPRSYLGKIMLVAFIGTHIPLLGLGIYIALSSSFTHHQKLLIVGAMLVTTVVGMAATLFILNKLLAPITLTFRGLRGYLNNGQLPVLPTEYRDEAGILMADTSYVVRQLDESMARLKDSALAGARAKNEFLSVMSHELRTPMNGILGYAELLSHTPSLPPDCHEDLRNLTTSAEALLQILDEVLDFSRLEAGRVKPVPQAFTPATLLDEIRRLFAPVAAGRQLDLRFDLQPSLPGRLIGDPKLLRQILINIVGNALKFTHRGHVTVSIRETIEREQRIVEFSVADTGPGISRAKLGLIFEPFSQVDSSMSRRFGGTGLGLTISRRLARLMGGNVDVTSHPGHGSRFSATIPLQLPPETAAAAAASPTVEPAPRSLRVLVVDDDATNLKLILSMVHRLGYTLPLHARDGREAVAIAQREPLDCILMDIQMPGVDGIEATRLIRQDEMEHTRHPTFICALTANTVPEDQQACFDAGMNHYMNKPVKLAKLSEALSLASPPLDKIV